MVESLGRVHSAATREYWCTRESVKLSLRHGRFDPYTRDCGASSMVRTVDCDSTDLGSIPRRHSGCVVQLVGDTGLRNRTVMGSNPSASTSVTNPRECLWAAILHHMIRTSAEMQTAAAVCLVRCVPLRDTVARSAGAATFTALIQDVVSEMPEQWFLRLHL